MVQGVYSERYLMSKLGQVNSTDLVWSPRSIYIPNRMKRHQGQTQVLTITVESHLAEGLKEVINQYLKEKQNEQIPNPLTSHLDDYHYDEEVLGSGNLFNYFASSGATRINTPFQCLWKRCSLGLFSTSGQGVTTWSFGLTIMVVVFHFCW